MNSDDADVCKNCGKYIERDAFDVGDSPYKWVHAETGSTFCAITLIAEPVYETNP